MNGRYLNKLLELNAEHALYREDGTWYHQLKKFPGVLFDRNGYVLFETEESFHNHPKLNIRKELHINHGISSIPEYTPFTSHQKWLVYGNNAADNLIIEDILQDDSKVIRRVRQVNMILRNRTLVAKLKQLYNNTCQICETRLQIGPDQYYSEVHHIVPLGHPHNGKDRLDNMICVCPNCHVKLDYGAIITELDKIQGLHEISKSAMELSNPISGLEYSE